jgi:soluble lytic murein transglycosylase-like protein
MSQTLALPQPTLRLADRCFRILHATLLGLGLFVSCFALLALLSAKLGDTELPSLGSATPSAKLSATQASATEGQLPGHLKAVADAIARRYRVALPAVEDIVSMAEAAAHAARLDPLLVIAIIGVESGFNPYAESPFGAQGLMQIIGRFHTDKFQPTPDGFALLDPAVNIQVGTKILSEYLQATGDLNAALKRYGGESETSGFGYPDKVHAEHQRLQQIIQRAGKA